MNVLDGHSELYPGRDVLSLLHKLQTLHRKKVTTRDPNIPEEIRFEKEIKDLIGLRAPIGDGADDFYIEGNGTYTHEEGETRSATPIEVELRYSGAGKQRK